MDTHWYIIEFEYLLREISSIKESFEYDESDDRDKLSMVYSRLTELVERYNKPVKHNIPKPGKLRKTKK